MKKTDFFLSFIIFLITAMAGEWLLASATTKNESSMNLVV